MMFFQVGMIHLLINFTIGMSGKILKFRKKVALKM